MFTSGIYFVDVLWLYAPLILVIERTYSSTCPSGGHVYSTLSYCYWVNTTAMTFPDADNACKIHGGRLAKIPDADAKQFVEDNLGSVISISSGWVGVKTDDYVNFITVEGEAVTYLPWKTSFTYNGQCILLATETSPFMYEEANCNSYHQSVCNSETTGSVAETTTLNNPTTQTTTHQSTEARTTDQTTPAITKAEPTTVVETINSETTTTSAVQTTVNSQTTITTQENQATIQTTEPFTTEQRTTAITNKVTTGSTLATTPSTSSVTSTDPMQLSQTSTSSTSTDTPRSETAVVTTLSTTTHKENNSTCLCVCYGSTNISDEALQLRLQEIVNILTVPKKTTSASLRKLISAPDDRVSARGIGYVGAAILVTVFGIIMLTDITNILAERNRFNKDKNF